MSIIYFYDHDHKKMKYWSSSVVTERSTHISQSSCKSAQHRPSNTKYPDCFWKSFTSHSELSHHDPVLWYMSFWDPVPERILWTRVPFLEWFHFPVKTLNGCPPNKETIQSWGHRMTSQVTAYFPIVIKQPLAFY